MELILVSTYYKAINAFTAQEQLLLHKFDNFIYFIYDNFDTKKFGGDKLKKY